MWPLLQGQPALIIFEPGTSAYDKQHFDKVQLGNGGVYHVDGDGSLRWHPPQKVRMVIFEEEV